MNYLYIIMGPNKRGNEPDMKFKLKMQVVVNKAKFLQNVLVLDK